MGLDMYLKVYHKDSVVLSCEDVNNDCIVCNGCGNNILLQWRKANQIHGWFVENVQNGNDDCGKYEVSIKQLEELRELCIDVLLDHELANTLLPTTNGFFFGNDEYDEHYFEQLENTKEQLDKIIKNHKHISCYHKTETL